MPGARVIREAVLECFRANSGGPLALQEIETWVERAYPGCWAKVYADVAALVIGRSSECYHANQQFLHRVSRGVYQLDPAFMVGTGGGATGARPPSAPGPAKPTHGGNPGKT